MKMKTKIFAALVIAALAAAAPGLADKGKGNNKSYKSEKQATRQSDDREDVLVNRFFSNMERALIAEFYGQQWAKVSKDGGSLPPGLAKRKELPPGLQKQLVRKGRLPPGLAKRSLPSDLLKRLPAAPKGTERIVAGADVLLIDIASQVILDVIKGALNPPSQINWNN
jgi:Ni/Co efflux regulator RcnB